MRASIAQLLLHADEVAGKQEVEDLAPAVTTVHQMLRRALSNLQ